MNIEKYDSNLQTVRQRIKNLNIKGGTNLYYSAYFLKDGIKDCILNRLPVSKLSLVRKNLITEKPEVVRFELFDDESSRKILWMHNIDLRDEIQVPIQEQTPFKGLGEAEVNLLVQNKLSEILHNQEFKNLQEEDKKNKATIDSLNQQINEQQETIHELQGVIETKSGVKYYAGIVGDLLEGFGIKKERIRGPLAGLMGLIDESKSNQGSDERYQDSSGIIEDNFKNTNANENQQKRQEIIDLILQYLQTVSNDLLILIFNIFSELESKPNSAPVLLEYIKKLNQE